MKNALLLILIIISMLACKPKEEVVEQAIVSNEIQVIDDEIDTTDFPNFLGTYRGLHDQKPITIVISHCSGYNVTGYNHVNGLVRNLHGKISFDQGQYKITLNEPGDGTYDGAFHLLKDKSSPTATYEWKSFKENVRPVSSTLKFSSAKDLNQLWGDFEYKVEAVDQNTFFLIFGLLYDKFGYLNFFDDGRVKYEFYKTEEAFENETGDLLEANGSYVYENGKVTIYWQPNAAFPKLKSTFTIKKGDEEGGAEDEYMGYQLVGENKVFNITFY